MATSKSDASKAGKLLSNPKTPKVVKSVAASDLAQARGKVKARSRRRPPLPRPGSRLGAGPNLQPYPCREG